MNYLNRSLSYCFTTLLFLVPATLYSQKKTLEGHEVKSLELKVDPVAVIKPGETINIGVSATVEDGALMETTGMLKGKIKWSDFNIEVKGGTFDKQLMSGKITISSNPQETPDHEVVIKVTSVFHPEMENTVKLPLDFGVRAVADFGGRSGENGQNGQKGDAGKNDGSIYDRSKGSKGADGQNGRDGQSGQTGRNANTATVYVRAIKHKINDKTLLQVCVVSENGSFKQHYMCDAVTGSVVVNVNGGRGGSGGTGGDGGTGGSGQNVNNSESSKQEGGDGGTGGNGGYGGPGADGGDGGSATVYYDPSAEPYLDKIIVNNHGGSGGDGGMAGSAGQAGSGGNGYKSGARGNMGKAGQRNTQNGRSGQDGAAPVKIKKELTDDQFSF